MPRARCGKRYAGRGKRYAGRGKRYAGRGKRYAGRGKYYAGRGKPYAGRGRRHWRLRFRRLGRVRETESPPADAARALRGAGRARSSASVLAGGAGGRAPEIG